jgi:hypothetical protein
MRASCQSICCPVILLLLTAMSLTAADKEPNAALLICQRESGDSTITSYGTVTEIDGKFVTAWHVVEEGGTIKIAAENGWITATVERHDEFLDLALLKTEKKAKLSQLLRKGAQMTTPLAMAAPGGNLQMFSVKLVSVSKADDIGGEYIHLDHGSSGGCIRGCKGEFIGIIRGIMYIEEEKSKKKVQTNQCEFVPAQNVWDFLRRK